MENNKQKFIQILAAVVIFIAFFLNIFVFWSNEVNNWNSFRDPFQYTKFEQFDSNFLRLIEKDTWLKDFEIKEMMDASPWKTLREVFSVKWINMKWSWE